MASWRQPDLDNAVGRNQYRSLDVELQLQEQQDRQRQQQQQQGQAGHQPQYQEAEEGRCPAPTDANYINQGSGSPDPTAAEAGGSRAPAPGAPGAPDPTSTSTPPTASTESAAAAAAAKAAARQEHQPLLRPSPSQPRPGSSSTDPGAPPAPPQSRSARPAWRMIPPPPAARTAGGGGDGGGGGGNRLRAAPAGPPEAVPAQPPPPPPAPQPAQRPQSQHGIQMSARPLQNDGRLGAAVTGAPCRRALAAVAAVVIASGGGDGGGSGDGGGGAAVRAGAPWAHGSDASSAGTSGPTDRAAAITSIVAVLTFVAVVSFLVTAFAIWVRRAAAARDAAAGTYSAGLDGSPGAVNLTLRDMQLLRPGFHIRPPGGGWINDPNGLMQYGGMVHVFYQYNPYSDVWGPMHWGHAVSPDLVHWAHLPIALQPGDPWDRDGCWSGSALIAPDGVPRLFYTGATNLSQVGYYYQVQAVALPADPADPFLTTWLKPPELNPLGLTLPPGGVRSQFRDPIAPWRVPANQLGPDLAEWLLGWPAAAAAAAAPPPPPVPPVPAAGLNGSGGVLPGGGSAGFGNGSADGGGGGGGGGNDVWFTGLGAMDDCVGTAALYASADLQSWSYAGTLFSQLGQNYSTYQVCMAANATGLPPDLPPGMRGYGGPCDPIGSQCRMWECPGFLTLDTTAVEFSSAQVAAEAAAAAAAAATAAAGGLADAAAPPGGAAAASDALGGDVAVAVFKYSDQMRNRSGFAADWYQLGAYSLLNYSLAAYQDGIDVFQPRLLPPLQPPPEDAGAGGTGNGTDAGGGGGGGSGAAGGYSGQMPTDPQRWDYGTVYASQAFRMGDGRVVWMGWVYEDSLGCSEVCGQGNTLTKALGWQGMLSFPRVVTYDSDLHRLIVRPVQELALLRSSPVLYSGSGRALLELEAAADEGGGGGQEQTTEAAAAPPQPPPPQGSAAAAATVAAICALRSCCRPSAASCRNGTVEAGPVGDDGTAAAEGVSGGGGSGGPAPPAAAAPASCGDSACWMLLPEEQNPEVYGNDSAEGAPSGSVYDSTGGGGAGSSGLANGTVGGAVSAALRRQMEVQLNFTLQLLYLLPPPPPPPPTSPPPNTSQTNTTGTADQTPPPPQSGPQVPPPPPWLPVVFELGMRLLTGNGSYVSVYVNGTVPPPPPAPLSVGGGPPTLLPGGVATAAAGGGGSGLYVERLCAGGMTNGTSLQGGWLPLWTALAPEPPPPPPPPPSQPPLPVPAAPPPAGGGTWRVAVLGASLQVLIDHSVVEAFGGGGRARVTSRFYPSGEDTAWGVQAYAKIRTTPGGPPPPPPPQPESEGAQEPAEGAAASSSGAVEAQGLQRASVGFQGAVYRLSDGV